MDLLFIQDVIRGTHIGKTTKFLKSSDHWSREQLDEFRLEKFKLLVRHCYETVPYYRHLFDSVRLTPEEIQSIGDIQKIPILKKETIRENASKFISSIIDLQDKRIIESKTGGTTGMPLKFYKNDTTRDFTWGAFRRWYGWMGIRPSDKVAVIWGAKTVLQDDKSLKKRFVKTFGNTLTINSFNLNANTLPKVAKQLMDFRPILLRGYLSAIFQIAIYFKEHNLSLPSLKAITTTTETLLPIYRKYIEDTFNVKMFDQYGCGECNGIAFECDNHEGLHVTEEHCIVEVVDQDGMPCYDKPGRILITDLDNNVFPFIRYENGDSAIMSSSECSCGRHSVLLKELSGRTKDTIILKDGSEVHGVLFTDLFHELGYDNFEYFTRFQIYQKKRGDFECRLEATGKPIPSDKLNEIELALKKFGNDVKVVILPKLESDASGKFRYIISDLNN